MKLTRIALLPLLAAAAGFVPSTALGRQYRNAEGNTVSQGVVIETGDLAVSADNPLPSVSTPFQRMGKAFALPVSTTPQTYAIAQPEGAKAYRGINPCPVDIVISTVSATMPATTQPVTMNGKTIPNVLLVTSATGAVNEFEDTYFMARSGRVLSSSANPMAGSIRYVSIMALGDPGGTPCAFRLGYGGGGS